MNMRTERAGKLWVAVLVIIAVTIIDYGLFDPPPSTPLTEFLALIAAIILAVLAFICLLWALGIRL